MLTIDFETEAIAGNPIYNPPRPVGVSIKQEGQPSVYYAWGHPTENNCTFERARDVLLRALRKDRDGYLAHNAPFEAAVLKRYFDYTEPDPLRVHDTQYLLFLADPYANTFSLKPSAERILGLPPDEQADLRAWILANVPEARASNWGAYISKAPGELVGRYACGDTDRTRALYDALYPRILQAGMLEPYRREQKLMPILLASSERGVRLDMERLEADIEKYTAAKNTAEAYIHRTLGDFNIDSDAELAAALDRSGQVSTWVLTPTGKRSTSRKNLVGRVKDPALLAYLAYRGVLSTCLGTFAGPWLEQARAEGGRLHPQWNQVRGDRGSDGDISGTRTGRMSCIAFGERVLTDRGMVPIQDIVVGDSVLTHKLRKRRVLATITNGQREVKRYTFSNGQSVVCTPDHTFYTGSRWVAIQEIADGCVKAVDGSAHQRSTGTSTLQGYRKAIFNDQNCRGAGHNGAQRASSAGTASQRGEKTVAQPSSLGVEAGGDEPNVRENYGETPQLHGRVRGDLQNTSGGWAAEADSSNSGSGDGGITRCTDTVGCAPHRWGSDQQSPGQFSDLHTCGTSENTWHDAIYREQVVTITKVESVGVCEVYDLTVDEDASFGIAGVFAHNCRNPNLQNPPNEFDSLDIPPGLPAPMLMRRYLLPEPGHVWLKRDFSAQEMRIMAHFAEGRLFDAFRLDPRTDPHVAVQRMIKDLLGIDMPRKYVKITGFGIMYGRGVPNLSAALGVDQEEGKRVRDAYYAALPEIQQLSVDTRNRGRRNQFIRTWGGRVYYREPDPARDLSYKLLNYLIQGSAADQTKQAMIDWDATRATTDVLLAAVHDEVNISAPADDVPAAMQRLRLAMDADRFDVPFMSEGYTGLNWAEIEGYNDEQ